MKDTDRKLTIYTLVKLSGAKFRLGRLIQMVRISRTTAPVGKLWCDGNAIICAHFSKTTAVQN